jgi:hypothetical protein
MVNLFCLPKAIETKGASLLSKGQNISVTLGTSEIFFENVFKHGSGHLHGIKIHPAPNHIAATAQYQDINAAHEMFGHLSSQNLATTDAKKWFQHKKLTSCLRSQQGQLEEIE